MKNINKIKVNFLTYIFISLFLFSGYKNNIICIIFIFIVHELGHIFFCILFHVKIIKLEIFPFGGILKLNIPINYSLIRLFLISSGGLIFQVLLFLINLVFIHSKMLSSYNSLIFYFNILPIAPLDGFKILQCFLFKFISYYYALVFSYIVDALSLILLILYSDNIAFLLFSFVFLLKNVSLLSIYFNKFLFERYLYNFKYKKTKYYKHFNLKKLRINYLGYFYETGWKNENYFLRKKFDKNPDFW